ncbi:choline transporter [Grosmannia clavigera kw1407]|uniref:Choline transporter n=1 Tax=Grosmannia clavigera (strain kw1407 / UAMH 11150) TaxID=655863 RepID=F0XMZ6_GROCL|nr:choline transporter [Grosmannia clavigera kw1407]EFX00904.1 choline transporter [Grosmannia clavigera kw1407]
MENADVLEKKPVPERPGDSEEEVAVVQDGTVVNAAGYKDQLQRQYGLIGLAGIALTVDNAWVALGSSISVSILNGGPAGLLYGLIVAIFYYSFIGLGLAEITANISVSMYAVYHEDSFTSQPWQIYVAYLLILLLAAALVILANRLVPYTQHLGMFFVIVGGLVTIIVVAAMPHQRPTNAAVWKHFHENNLTGWQDGVAFLLGVLNGAFTIGTPDAITHMAEELPRPKRDLPRAIGLQLGLGFLYAFCFAICIFYSFADLSVLQDGSVNSYPLASIYQLATSHADGSPNLGATFGLLFIVWASSMLCCVGTVLTTSRIYWALARDNAVPLSGLFGRVNESLSCPVYATLFVSVVAAGLGAIPLGSNTAFLDLTGSFIILTTVSYAIAFGANVCSGRKYFPRGPFHLGRYGTAINILSIIFIVFFDIMYCFPYAMPTTVSGMTYNSVILVGVVCLTTIWWFAHAIRHYPGPKVMGLYIGDTDHTGQQENFVADPAGEK